MKKQIGNDVRLEWTILRKGVAEDFTDATDLSLTAFIPNLSIDELNLPIARAGNVFALNIPTTDLSIGTYTIRLQYKKPDPAFASGKASISTAVNGAFQIVPIGASEDDLNDELTSNVVYCTDGATFTPSVSVVGNEVILSWTNDKDYENPLPINIKGDKGDVGKSAYEYYLESTTETTPLTEAEFSTMLGNLPTYVQDAILATSNANTAATNANNAANTANQSALDADAAALLANNAAVNADWRCTANEVDIANLRVNFNQNIIGNTLFDKVGYISFSDGILINSDFWRATDYIPVEEGDTVRIKASVEAGAAILACYSSNKSYLKDKSIEIATSTMEIDNTYTIPAGVTYIKTCSLKSYPASITVILVNSLRKNILDLQAEVSTIQTDLDADELLLEDINNNALRKSIVGLLGDNLITPSTVFTDGKYAITNSHTVGSLGTLTYCSVPVIAGKTYRFTSYTSSLAGYVCRVLNASGTFIVDQSTPPFFNHIVHIGNNIIEITIPAGGVTLQINVLITQKSTAFVKQLYGETDKLPINWLEVTEENLNDELKEKVNNPQVTSVTAGQINGDFTIISSETLTGYSYSTGGYKNQVSDTQIVISTHATIHSAIITGVTEGDVLLVNMGQIVDPNGTLGSAFYIFGKTETVPAIKKSEIGNYVQLYDKTNKIYKVTIPKDCTIFYLTMSDNVQSTSFIKKCVTKKTLNWLKVVEENLDQTIISEIENTVSSNVQNSIETGQLDYESNYHLLDSINKPIDFNGKKLIAFGDSITSGVSSPGLVPLGSTKYISLFCSHVGAILTNQAISGSVITDSGSQYDMCKRVIQYATSAYDIVYIAGGTNDYNQNMSIGTYASTDKTTLYGALRTICEHLKTNCPNAVVIFVTPIPYTSVARRTKVEIQKLDTVRSAIYDIATLYGYNVVNGKDLGMPKTSGNWNHAMVDDSDGCHPTELGHSLYAKCLAGKLL